MNGIFENHPVWQTLVFITGCVIYGLLMRDLVNWFLREK